MVREILALEVFLIEDSISIFNLMAEEYDRWFDRHPYIFQSELNALKKIVPEDGRGLEIGVGTGRFAERLGIKYGVEPAASMRVLAEKRGIQVVDGMAEILPFSDNYFDHAVMITTLCFVKAPLKVLEEAKRVIKPGGRVIIGMIDRESYLGKNYEGKKQEHPYYQFAHFLSPREVIAWMQQLDFQRIKTYQTLFQNQNETTTSNEARKGYGEGGFVAIGGEKRSQTHNQITL